MKKSLKLTIYYIVLTVLVAVALGAIFSSVDRGTRYKFLTVKSGSMFPSIPTGSLIVIKSEPEYKVSDIITFSRKIESTDQITHRVMMVQETESGSSYVTKGDANEEVDGEVVTQDRVIGKTIISIPLLGFIVSKAGTPVGLVAFVLIPGLWIIVAEFVNIWREVQKQKIHKKGFKSLSYFK